MVSRSAEQSTLSAVGGLSLTMAVVASHCLDRDTHGNFVFLAAGVAMRTLACGFVVVLGLSWSDMQDGTRVPIPQSSLSTLH